MRSSTRAPVGRLLAFGEVGGDHDAGGPHLALDVAVLVEAPVDEVLVVRHGRVEGEDQPPAPAHLRPGDLVHVLPEDGVVLLVDADGVLDGVGLAGGVVEDRVEVGDLAQAVAAQLQRGRHEPEAPLADVEGRAPEVFGAGIPVGHDHLRERHPVRHGPDLAAVVVADGVEHEPLAVVEPDAHGPLLPPELVAVQDEGGPLGLRDLERFQVAALPQAGDVFRDVLAHDLRLLDREGVLDLQQLRAVEVDY